jgi:hypothetical protein
MSNLIATFAIQLLGIKLISYGVGGIVIDIFKRKGRAFLGILTVWPVGMLAIIGALLALEGALNVEQGLPPHVNGLIGDAGYAYVLVLLPIFLMVALGLNLSQRIAEFRNP